MKKITGLFVVLLIIFLMNACHTPAYYLEDTGITSEHELNYMKKWRNQGGEIEGSFFLLGGGIRGKLFAYSSIQFSWSNKPGQMIISELSFAKIRFVFDNSKQIPTIKFKFDYNWWNEPSLNDYSLQTENLNKYVQGDNLEVAVIRISKEQYNKEFASD